MRVRRALLLIVCLLDNFGTFASRLKVSRAARQAAKARLVGDIAELARALRNGLSASQAPPGTLAELARERLGMEAEGMEPAGAALLRAFAGGAPDSVLIVPPEGSEAEDEAVLEDSPEGVLQADAPDGQGFVVVEEGESPPEMETRVPDFVHESPPEMELRVPDFVHGPVEGVPSAEGIVKENTVGEAARHLASEMRTIQDSFGRKVLDEIIQQFFASRKAPTPAQPQAKLPSRLKPKFTIGVHAAGRRGGDLEAAAGNRTGTAAGNKTEAAAMLEKRLRVSNSTAQHAASSPPGGAINAEVPWPKGSTNATWHDRRGSTFVRKCDGRHCVTRVMRPRTR